MEKQVVNSDNGSDSENAPKKKPTENKPAVVVPAKISLDKTKGKNNNNLRRMPDEVEIHTCRECGKCFTDLVTLKEHGRYHRRKKNHTCRSCDKSFIFSTALKVHERIHIVEKNLTVAGYVEGHLLMLVT